MELFEFKKIKIYVEGFDKIFVKDFIKIIFPQVPFSKKELDSIVVDIGGYTNLPNFVTQFIDNQNAGIKNILLLDADYTKDTEPNNGFLNKCSFIDRLMHESQLKVPYYLFPNHNDDGDLELLLTKCINPENQLLLDCWNALEKCVNDQNGNSYYELPSNKSKIYFYLECLST
jgi:hypothetical protein